MALNYDFSKFGKKVHLNGRIKMFEKLSRHKKENGKYLQNPIESVITEDISEPAEIPQDGLIEETQDAKATEQEPDPELENR